MRKLFPLVLSGMLAASFSQIAAAQSANVQGPAGTGATDQQQGTANQAQDTVQRGEQNQDAQQTTGDRKLHSPGATGSAGTQSGPNPSAQEQAASKNLDSPGVHGSSGTQSGPNPSPQGQSSATGGTSEQRKY
jgi:hypothetical protein